MVVGVVGVVVAVASRRPNEGVVTERFLLIPL